MEMKMNKYRLIISALALSTMPILSGCNTVARTVLPDSIANAVTTPPCQPTLADNKARYGAEALYNVPSAAYRSANERHLLDSAPALKATIKGKLQMLAGYLKGLRAAHKICDSTTLLQYRAGMERIKAEVMPLIPGQGVN
jgi:hypothetical protein